MATAVLTSTFWAGWAIAAMNRPVTTTTMAGWNRKATGREAVRAKAPHTKAARHAAIMASSGRPHKGAMENVEVSPHVPQKLSRRTVARRKALRMSSSMKLRWAGRESLPARMGRARLNTAVTPRESWAIQRSNELKMGMAQAKTTWASESSRSVATGKRKVFKSTAATMAQAMAMIERARAMRVKQREANQK